MKLKDIRFNLRFSKGVENGEEKFDIIRSLQDLQDHLNVDDLFLYFSSGQLSRWLICLGEQEKADAVKKIDTQASPKVQLYALFDALGFEIEKRELDVLLESFVFSKELKDKKASLCAQLDNVKKVVAEDYAQYAKCLNDIIAVAEDFSAVKARVRALLKNFPEQFKLDWMRFYDVMIERCPLAIFVVLMDPDYRKFYLGSSEEELKKYYGELGVQTKDVENCRPLETFMKRAKDIFFTAYPREFKRASFTNELKLTMDNKWDFTEDSYLLKDGNIIRQVDYEKSGGEWQDALDKDTLVMILYCGDNITIRPHGDKQHQVKGNQGGAFPIFNGLDFRTSNAVPESVDDILLYMEVK